jgi:acyl dehydratase
MPSLEPKPGSQSSLVRVFTQNDFDRFAALSGDDNPIHVDPHFCTRTRFGRTVAHGMLLYSVMSGLVHRSLEGAVQPIDQELIFRAPTFTGEEVRFEVEIIGVGNGEDINGIVPNQNNPQVLVTLEQTAIRADGEHGLEGLARCLLLPPTNEPGLGTTYNISNDGEESGLHQDPTSPVKHKNLQLGETASRSRTFTPGDLAEYHALTGDPSLILPGQETSLLPWGLTGSLFSYLLGALLPGPGTNWLKQRLRFLAPTNPGQELTASVSISRLRPEKDLVNLITLCWSGSQLICEGEALVLVKDLVKD